MLRQLSIFRPPKRGFHTSLSFQKHWSLLLPVLSILLMPFLVFTVPKVWVRNQTQQYWQDWHSRSREDMSGVVLAWGNAQVPIFTTGQEPEVVAYLQGHPLIAAVASQTSPTLWFRDGDRFRQARPEQEANFLGQSLRKAVAAQQATWSPLPQEPAAMITIHRGGPWYVLERWSIGSPEVETFLRFACGQGNRIRVGIQRDNPNERPTLTNPPWSRAPHIQAECAQGDRTTCVVFLGNGGPSGTFWQFVFFPSWEENRIFQKRLLLWKGTAYGLSGLVLGSMWIGLFIHNRLRRRERLETDRFASMAHSLKTPLGVLKLRCDSIRLGQFDPIQTEVELLRIGKEVDSLTAYINQSLQGFHKQSEVRAREPIPPELFQEVAKDLKPIFHMEEREFHLELDPGWGLANPSTLRTALVTLLENAIAYGDGGVTLRTRRQGPTLCIQVQDQGKGLDPMQLGLLGKPFTRFRATGKEGFQREGWGLGIFLLTSTAQQEGWGFSISSQIGEGLLATVQIPLDGSTHKRIEPA